jgi:hypothetical protein
MSRLGKAMVVACSLIELIVHRLPPSCRRHCLKVILTDGGHGGGAT